MGTMDKVGISWVQWIKQIHFKMYLGTVKMNQIEIIELGNIFAMKKSLNSMNRLDNVEERILNWRNGQ